MRIRSLVLPVLALVLMACQPSREPRALRPETDVCAECRMTVVPEGHAAEAIDAEGQILVFDDVGCLALYVHDHAQRFVGATSFVEDQRTKDWVNTDSAWFVRADAVSTPMNYGWHAFASRDVAEAFARDQQGKLLESGGLDAVAADVGGRRWQP